MDVFVLIVEFAKPWFSACGLTANINQVFGVFTSQNKAEDALKKSGFNGHIIHKKLDESGECKNG